jgi:hypothetical protein
MNTERALAVEEIAALYDYAAAHGKGWKDDLWCDWIDARTTGVLQRIRNTFGPTWLNRFRFLQDDQRKLDAIWRAKR